jgi:hypothetical protein
MPSPSLIIGLGGVGKKFVTQLKAHFIDSCGEVPSTVRLMAFDIDIKEETEMVGKREIALIPAKEMIDLGDVPASDIVMGIKQNRYPELRDWFQPDVPLQEANLRGSGQQNRQLGRLAFFWSLRARSLYHTLNSAVNILRQEGLHSRIGEVDRARGGELMIYIVGSLAGGTGSSIAIDTAYILQYIVDAIGIRDTTSIVGVFLLPESGKVRQDIFQANSLATLQELEYFMTSETDDASRLKEIEYLNGSPVPRVDCSDRPFDLCYLIDIVSARGDMLPSLRQMLSLIVEGIFSLTSSNIEAEAWSRTHNLGRRLAGTRVFSSFGVASLIFPAVQIQNICAARISREVIDQLLTDPPEVTVSELPRDLDRYMAQQPLTYIDLMTRLQIATDGRQIRLDLLGDERLSDARLDAIPKDQWFVVVTRQVDEIVSTWEAAARRRIENYSETLLVQLMEDDEVGLKRKVRDMVNNAEQGLSYAVRFLEALEARLRSLETEVEHRRSEAEVNEEAAIKRKAHFADEFDEQERRSGRLFTRANPKQARERYLRASNDLLQHTFSLDSHTCAKALLAQLAEKVRALLDQLGRLAGSLNYVRDTYLENKEQVYQREIANMDTVRRKPITRKRDIDRMYEERRSGAVHKVMQNILAGDVPQGGEGLYGLLSAEADEIGNVIFSLALQSVEDILEIHLEDIIEERKKEHDNPVPPEEWMQDLHENAVVWWKEHELTGTTDDDITMEFTVIGIEDTKTSIYPLSGDRRQIYCSTGDPHRITVLQTRHALNYRDMKRYGQFSNSYRRAVQRGYPLHIFPGFATYADRKRESYSTHETGETSRKRLPLRYQIWITPASREISVGQSISVDVELSPALGGSQVNQLTLPETVSEVFVFLKADGLRIQESEVARIDVKEPDSPKSASFKLHAQLCGNRPYTIELVAEDPISGQINIYKASGHILVLPPKAIEDHSVALPKLDIRIASQPHFILDVVTALPEGESGPRYLTYFLSSRLPGVHLDSKKVGTITLYEQEVLRIRKILREVLSQTAIAQPVDARERMISFGTYLFDLLFPVEHTSAFHDALWQAENRLNTWLIREDDNTGLPWELVVPRREDDTASLRFLAERYRLSRWIEGLGPPLYDEIPLGEIALAQYNEPGLVEENQERRLQAWRELLQSPGVSSIRSVLRPDTPFYGIHLLRDAKSITARRDLVVRHASDAPDSPETDIEQARLYSRLKRPVVTLSILGKDNDDLREDTDDWLLPERVLPFLRAGASAVVGPWWPTSEAADQVFWSRFYDLLARRLPLGEVVWQARMAVQRARPENLDWLAYTLFGDPRARAYWPEPSEGYTVLERLDPDTPLRPGGNYTFRVSLRNRPPVWYKDRLVQPEALPDRMFALFFAPGIQSEFNEPIEMTPMGRTMLQATIDLTPPSPGDYSILAQLLEGDEQIKTLQLTLKVPETASESSTGREANE